MSFLNKKLIVSSVIFFLITNIVFFLYFYKPPAVFQLFILGLGFLGVFFIFFLSILWLRYPITSVYSFFFLFSLFYNSGFFLVLLFEQQFFLTSPASVFSLPLLIKVGFFTFVFCVIMHISFITFVKKSNTLEISQAKSKIFFPPADRRAIFFTALFLLGVSVVPFLILNYRLIKLQSSGYLEMFYFNRFYSGEIMNTYLRAIANYFIVSLIMLYSVVIKSKFKMIIYILFIFYFIIYSILGTRSRAILPLFSFFIAHAFISRPNKKTQFFLPFFWGGIFLFTYSPIMLFLRSGGNITMFNLFDRFLVPIKETVSCTIATAYTMQEIPRNIHFWYASSYYLSIIESMPFFSRFLSMFDFKFLTPFTWFNINFDPLRYSLGGGWGYSYIAEAYANMGYFSLLTISPILAKVLVKMDDCLKKLHPYKAIFIILAIPHLLFMARGSFDDSARNLLLYALFPSLFAFFLRYIFTVQRK